MYVCYYRYRYHKRNHEVILTKERNPISQFPIHLIYLVSYVSIQTCTVKSPASLNFYPKHVNLKKKVLKPSVTLYLEHPIGCNIIILYGGHSGNPV